MIPYVSKDGSLDDPPFFMFADPYMIPYVSKYGSLDEPFFPMFEDPYIHVQK